MSSCAKPVHFATCVLAHDEYHNLFSLASFRVGLRVPGRSRRRDGSDNDNRYADIYIFRQYEFVHQMRLITIASTIAFPPTRSSVWTVLNEGVAQPGKSRGRKVADALNLCANIV